MTPTAEPDLGFTPDTASPKAEPDVGFVAAGAPSPKGDDAAMDQKYGVIRAPTFYEKTAQAWNQATHGLFSAGPRAAPAHVEGVKTEWSDLPHVVGGMVIQQLLNPGNILSFGAARAVPAIQSVMGKVFGTVMAAGSLRSAPGLGREIFNPEVSGAQKIADSIAVGGQALLAGMAFRGPSLPNVNGGVYALSNAVKAMKPDEAGQMLAQFHGATPDEIADILTKQAAKTQDPATVEHLNAARDQFQRLADMQPEAVQKLNEAQKAWDEVQRVMAPATRGPNAEIAAGALREMGGDLAQRGDRAEAALKASSKILMALPEDTRWASVDQIEKGEIQTNPELQPFADTTRQIFDSRREEIQGLGTGKLDHYIDDYFAHLWKDPEDATIAFRSAAAKAPIEGTKGFLKQRTIPTIAEGRALGLEPISENPVEQVLLAARQMDKYIVAQNWISEMKDRKLVSFVKAGDLPPDGYEPINDKIAVVYGPRMGAVGLPDEANIGQADVQVFGKRIMGQYYAPNEVAGVANNYLAPGLRRYSSFRALMSAGNTLNRFQLGLSAFHLGFTSIDTSISKLALAIEYGTEGKALKAAGKAAQVPIAPVSNMLEGNRVLKEWMQPGSQGAEIGKVADAIRMAGGRAKMDQLYQTSITKNMMTAWKEGKALGAIWRAPFAAMEQISKPLMEYVVPRQKMGVAADLMRREMERMPEGATPDQMRAAFGKVWDSVDNRMGQLVYDNLFWNKAMKDLSMVAVRSVGWDLGTIREIGGGIVDTGKFLADLTKPDVVKVEGGKLTQEAQAKFTHRMAYTIALPILTGMLGATYQYLKTGKGPEEPRDYFFPKTGEKDPQGRDVRLAMPTYMKDVYHYAHDPVGTVTGKLNPAISDTWEMLSNKDYFGRDIRNADDPLVKQMLAEAKFAGEAFLPIGVRNLQVSMAAGQTKAEEAANFVGVTRAPAWVGETTAEQLAGKLAGDKFKGAGTPDTELVAQKQRIMSAMRNGNDEQKTAAKEELAQLVEQEKMTPTQARNLLKGTDRPYLQNAISHLDAKEAMRVFNVASSAEREVIAEDVRRKIMRAHLPAEDRKELMQRFRSLAPVTRNIETTYR